LEEEEEDEDNTRKNKEIRGKSEKAMFLNARELIYYR
jgi:hypothetical protein